MENNKSKFTLSVKLNEKGDFCGHVAELYSASGELTVFEFERGYLDSFKRKQLKTALENLFVLIHLP